MKDFGRQVVVLTLIAVFAALALAGVDLLTREKIEEQRRLKLLNALEAVLPPHDNAPDADFMDVERDGASYRFYLAKSLGELVGCAVKTVSEMGYGGRIEVLTGILPNGDLQNVIILYHRETPGLGSKITTHEFLERLIFKARDGGERRNLRNTDWRVKKDGGDIDQLTGATISPRAVVEAVKTALDLYQSSRTEIVGELADSGMRDEPVE